MRGRLRISFLHINVANEDSKFERYATAVRSTTSMVLSKLFVEKWFAFTTIAHHKYTRFAYYSSSVSLPMYGCSSNSNQTSVYT